MKIEEGLYSYLTTVATPVIALAGARGFPILVPLDTTLPAWAYQVISQVKEKTHSGSEDLWMSRVQMTCIGSTYSQASGLAQAMYEALDCFEGVMGTVYVHVAQCGEISDGYPGNAETFFEQNVKRFDVVIWHE